MSSLRIMVNVVLLCSLIFLIACRFGTIGNDILPGDSLTQRFSPEFLAQIIDDVKNKKAYIPISLEVPAYSFYRFDYSNAAGGHRGSTIISYAQAIASPTYGIETTARVLLYDAMKSRAGYSIDYFAFSDGLATNLVMPVINAITAQYSDTAFMLNSSQNIASATLVAQAISNLVGTLSIPPMVDFTPVAIASPTVNLDLLSPDFSPLPATTLTTLLMNQDLLNIYDSMTEVGLANYKLFKSNVPVTSKPRAALRLHYTGRKHARNTNYSVTVAPISASGSIAASFSSIVGVSPSQMSLSAVANGGQIAFTYAGDRSISPVFTGEVEQTRLDLIVCDWGNESCTYGGNLGGYDYSFSKWATNTIQLSSVGSATPVSEIVCSVLVNNLEVATFTARSGVPVTEIVQIQPDQVATLACYLVPPEPKIMESLARSYAQTLLASGIRSLTKEEDAIWPAPPASAAELFIKSISPAAPTISLDLSGYSTKPVYAFSLPLFMEIKTGSVTGNIKNVITSTVISECVVNVRAGSNTKTGTISQTITSDASGNYTLTLDPGNHTLQFEKPGFETLYLTVTVTKKQAQTQNISLAEIIVNQAPVITSNGSGATANVNAAENQTAVTTVTASDPENAALTYSISGGADALKFSITGNTGVLVFASAPDYETKTDADTNNVYEVQVSVSDGTNTDIQTISVTATDINEAPAITSNGGGTTANVNAAENQTTVTTVTASDPENAALTYSISGGADALKFSITGNTGVLVFASAPDYETKVDADTNNVYEVQVTVSDGTNTDIQAIAVTVTDANEVPVITSNGGGATASVSAVENQTAVTTVTASDPENTALTYSISGGADVAKFSITGNTGVLVFASAPNYETKADADTNNVYVVQVTVSDGTNTDVQTISVTVTDVNEAPAITSNGSGATASVSAAENQTAVTTVTASDPENAALTYSISGGADAVKFSINSNTGVLVFTLEPDYETKADADTNNVYEVQVSVSDGTYTDMQAIAVAVTDVINEPLWVIGTTDGLFISKNNGLTFSKKTTANGLGSNSINSVVVNGTKIYAGTTAGLSISTDGGTSFTNKTTVDGLGNNSVSCPDLYVSGTTIYAGTSGGLSISTDGGTSFTNKTTVDGLSDNGIRSLAVYNGKILAGAYGLRVSTNSGASFSNPGCANLGYSDRGIVVTSTKMYHASIQGVSISTDGGANFTRYDQAGNGLVSNTVYRIAYANGKIYAGTNAGLSISSNEGTLFTTATNMTVQTNAMQVVGTTVYVGTNSGMHVSGDDFATPGTSYLSGEVRAIWIE